MENFITELERAFELNGLKAFFEPCLTDKFNALADRLVEVNSVMNLTAITDPRGVAVRHIADSLTVCAHIPEGAKVIDIGCGAGFPSLPLAIARPDVTVLALDSTAKRISFVSETAALLGLDNLSAVAARAEDAAKDPTLRESFDVAVSRAVARLNVLDELCLPFVRVGGAFAAMKGDGAALELEEARRGLKILCGEVDCLHSFELLGEDEPQSRAIIVVKKTAKTDEKYPRDYARIKKKPL